LNIAIAKFYGDELCQENINKISLKQIFNCFDKKYQELDKPRFSVTESIVDLNQTLCSA